MVMGYKHHQEKDHYWDQGEGSVIEDLAVKLGFALLPIAQLGAILYAYLVYMGEIPGKFVGFGVTVSGVAFQCAIQNLLHLR